MTELCVCGHAKPDHGFMGGACLHPDCECPWYEWTLPAYRAQEGLFP